MRYPRTFKPARGAQKQVYGEFALDKTAYAKAVMARKHASHAASWRLICRVDMKA